MMYRAVLSCAVVALSACATMKEGTPEAVALAKQIGVPEAHVLLARGCGYARAKFGAERAPFTTLASCAVLADQIVISRGGNSPTIVKFSEIRGVALAAYGQA